MAERMMAERMMAERIRVSGFRQPFVMPERRDPVRAVARIRPLNLIGPLGAAGMLVAVAAWGTPHMLLFYEITGSGAFAYYTDCAYTGLDGSMVHTRGMACPYFRLLKPSRSL